MPRCIDAASPVMGVHIKYMKYNCLERVDLFYNMHS